jgi:FixJ family two-component response regulator
MTGDELARKLKAKKRSLRVLFMTGYADKLPGHGTQVLPKPVKLDDLTEAVGRLLRRPATRR